MVEVQNISINDLVKTDHGFDNEIILSPYKQEMSMNLANESELHRILMHLNRKTEEEQPEKKKSGYEKVPSLFTLEVGKNVTRYNRLIESNGELKISKTEYVLDEEGNKILDEDNHYVTKKTDSKTYVATFCGAGHSRSQKNLFVAADVVDKLNDILLCGIPSDLVYDRPSKWNAYYAMVTTDSTALRETPNIVVIPDYKKIIKKEKVDVVEVSDAEIKTTDDKKNKEKYSRKKYKVVREKEKDLDILPFDGAGLVTLECALKWAKELGCRSKSGKFYIPSCFQFRAIPGIKGEVMVFNLRRFAREKHVSKIIDLGGREWDLLKDKIDVILTESQFKFWKLYCENGKFNYMLWRNEYDKKCHGYQRTFNIVSYAVHPEDLPKRTMLSYQPEQTINFTDEEIPKVSKMGLDIYRRISSNVDDFLKYRALLEVSEEDGGDSPRIDQYTPPYYVALLRNKELFYDDYIHGKIEKDIEKIRNNILSGKLFVSGNYQVFMPDLYGLAEWTFHEELGKDDPEGLLKKPYHIYSNWWNEVEAKNDTELKKVDMIRNPHVGMEHRICYLQNNDELRKWFKFQTTGIVTGMYDTLALALGTADFDGDTVCTTNNQQFVDAVEREADAGRNRLVIKEELTANVSTIEPVKISDRLALMKINQKSFKNSIGSVIDRVTDLWSCVNEDESKVRDYIQIGVIVGGETIDFAKTGENAAFPDDIREFFKEYRKRAYWMRYLEKNRSSAIAEEKALSRAKKFGKSEAEIEKIRKYIDYDCNMNRLCHYAEKEVRDIDCKCSAVGDSSREFDHREHLLRGNPSIKREVFKRVKTLQEEYKEISRQYRTEALKSKTVRKIAANKYRWFYNKCRTELLILESDIDKLIDMLVIIYYGDRRNGSEFLELEKDILWNAFPQEMVARCVGEKIETEIDCEKLKKNHAKNVEYVKAQKEKKRDKKKVIIKSIDVNDKFRKRVVCLTKGDRDYINKEVERAFRNKWISRKNVIKIKRVLAMLIYLSRKCEDDKGRCRIRKMDNVPNEITDLTLEKLTGVGHKNMDAYIALFENMDVVQSTIRAGETKISVLFSNHPGDVWFETEDYNKAGTMIRDYYRVEDAVNLPKKKKLKRFRKK